MIANRVNYIIAGGALNLTGQAADNRARTVTVNAQRSGTAYAWSNYNEGCGGFDGCDYNYNAYRDSAYVQDVPQTITLNAFQTRSFTAPGGTGTQVAAAAGASIGSSGPSTPGALSAAGVHTVPVNLTIPTTSLFRLNPNPAGGFLVETDPRFASYRTWLGSDYMLGQLALDPTVTQKRLGDGFYEQRLINEQVAQLTGQRFLSNYSNEEAQYKALMDAGITYAQTYNLRPGIALSAVQMAQLTSDIVWLVEQEVTLADGSKTRALVPQVYVHVKDTDLAPSGAMLAGQSVNINLAGDLTNSGTVAGRTVVNLTAENVQNLGGRITGDAVTVASRNDLNNIGGQIIAASSLNASAGRDLNVVTTTSSASNRTGGLGTGGNATVVNASSNNTFSMTGIDRVAGLYVTGGPLGTGTLVASAGRDANIIAGVISNNGAGGNTVISAGNNLNLATVTTANSSDQRRGGDDFVRDAQTQEVGSQIQAAGSLSLIAGNDLNARAASVQATGDLTASAGNNVHLSAGRQTHSFGFGLTTAESDLFSSSSTKERRSSDQDNAVGSSLGGNTVTVVAGKDIKVQGSAVISDTGTTLAAGRNIAIEAAQNTSSSTSFFEKNESGLLDSGGIGLMIGSREQSKDQKDQTKTATASTVGAISGNMNLLANDVYKQVGSDILAPQGNITIAAKTVEIVEARETRKVQTEDKFKESGLTVAVTAPVITALQTAEKMGEAASQTKDGRMQVLAGVTTALAAKNAYDAVKADPKAAGGINIAITVGSSKSQTNTDLASDSARGSTVAASGNVDIVASGAGKDSDILVRGSTVQGGKTVTLSAEDEIKLLAALNNSQLNRNSSGSSAGVGVAISVGSGGAGFGITANASASRGEGHGEDTTWTNTLIESGQQVTLVSGADTTIKGAVVKAPTVKADVGGDLNIESLQDTSVFNSKDQSIGGSVTVGVGFSGSLNFSDQKINSDFKSVTEQSGIKAGDGGFQVSVAGNTDLKGSVIASTDKAVTDGKNVLVTGTLTQSGIQNKAEYNADSIALGGGYSDGKGLIPVGGSGGSAGSAGGVGTDASGKAQTGAAQTPGSTLPGYNGFSATVPISLSASGDASTTTGSGISAGVIAITGGQKQEALTGQTADQTVASLNTGVRSDQGGSNALKPIFNEQEIKAGFEVIGAFARETGTFLANRAAEADAKKAERDAALARGDEQAVRKLDGELQGLQQWGSNGDYRKVITAVVGAISGNVTGDGGALVQGTAVNYLQSLGAQKIGELVDSFGTGVAAEAARTALQSVLACVGAAAQGNSCSSAAAGAGAGVVINALLGDTEGLTAQQKEARKNIVTNLVAAIAAQGGDVSVAVNAAAIETENNALSLRGSIKLANTLRSCWGNSSNCNIEQLRADMKQDSAKQALRIDAACSATGSVSQCMALAATANTTAMNLLTAGLVYADSPEKQRLIAELVTQQVADMDRLYAALDKQSAAAGITDMLGAAIAQTIQIAGMSGMIVRSGGKANSAAGKYLEQELAAKANVKPDTSRDAEYIAKTDKTILKNNNFDMDHVLSGEINAGGKATGYHAEFAADGQARIAQGTTIKQNPNGTYEAQVQIWDQSKGAWVDKVTPGGNPRLSTFFPPEWSQARVEYEVSVAFKVKVVDPQGGWRATTPSGLEIKFYWDAKNQRTTFYPTGK